MEKLRGVYSQYPLWGEHKKKTSATDQIHEKGSMILNEVKPSSQHPPKPVKQRTVKPIPKGEKEEFKVKEKKVSRSQLRLSKREAHPPRPVKKIGKDAHLGPNVEKLDRMIQTIIESARGLIYEFLPKYDRLALSKNDLLLPLFTQSKCEQTLAAPFVAAKSWAKGTSEERKGINCIQLVCGLIEAGESWDSYNASIIHYAKRLQSYVSLSDQLSSPNEKESNVEQMTQSLPKLEGFTKIFFRSFVGLMIRDLKKTPYLQSSTVSLADALLTVECLVKDEHITDIDKFTKSEDYYTGLKKSVLLQKIALKITKQSVSLLLDASLHIPLEQKEEFLIAHLYFFKRFKLPLGRRCTDKVSDPQDPVAMLDLALQSIRDDRKYLAKLKEDNLNNISRVRVPKSSVSIAPERPVKTPSEEVVIQTTSKELMTSKTKTVTVINSDGTSTVLNNPKFKVMTNEEEQELKNQVDQLIKAATVFTISLSKLESLIYEDSSFVYQYDNSYFHLKDPKKRQAMISDLKSRFEGQLPLAIDKGVELTWYGMMPCYVLQQTDVNVVVDGGSQWDSYKNVGGPVHYTKLSVIILRPYRFDKEPQSKSHTRKFRNFHSKNSDIVFLSKPGRIVVPPNSIYTEKRNEIAYGIDLGVDLIFLTDGINEKRTKFYTLKSKEEYDTLVMKWKKANGVQ